MIKTEDDLQLLIGTQESREIDFKQTLHLDDKKGSDSLEMCRDVSAFANTIGGKIIYGMKEEKLIATELVGIALDDLDATVQKIENKIKEKVEPRIPGLNILPIKLSNNNFAVVINIPKSWLGPHGFTFDKGWRFYIRGSTQTNFVTIDQLRDLFIQSNQLIDRVRDFRNKRISEILAEVVSVEFNRLLPTKFVIHIIPTIAFSPSYSIDFLALGNIRDKLYPIFGRNEHSRFNFDGYLSYCSHWEGTGVANYFQLFRNGIIETVDSQTINFNNPILNEHINLASVEEEVNDLLKRTFDIYNALNINSPVFVLISLLNAKGKKCSVDRSRYVWFSSNEIDREHLLFPEVLFEIEKNEIGKKLEDLFLPIWHSFGSNVRLV